MYVKEFLAQLRRQNIQLWVEDNRLRYRAPKGRLTPALRQKLTLHKPALLDLLRERSDAGAIILPPLQPIDRDGKLFLSQAQEGIWFFHQLEPGLIAYNIPAAFRLTGSLNVDALERAVSEIVRRHEVFRSICMTSDGQPSLRILSSVDVPFQVIDRRGTADAVQEDVIELLVTEEARRPFSLEHAPLLRVTVWQLENHEYLLLFVTHHFVADGWAMGIFFRELSILYNAFSEGTPSPLPELSVQYVDVTHWQRQWFQGEILESQRTFWTQQLANAPENLELPLAHPYPLVRSYRGATQSFLLPDELTDALKTLNRQEGVTLFMTLLAAFQILLYRYSGQEDLVVGTTVSNRKKAEIEHLIGSFANNLLLRVDCSGNPTFRTFLHQVSKVCRDAYSNQDLPYEMLVEELQPKRDLSRNPLFQVSFFLHHYTKEQIFSLSGVVADPMQIELGTARADVGLTMSLRQQTLFGRIEYSTDLFDKVIITRMLQHFQILLKGIVYNPNQHLSELTLLTDTERQQILVDWNKTEEEYCHNRCVHHLFEAQVELTPDTVAMVFEDWYLTYRELNLKANQLAHFLKKRGVGPDVLVGLCVERSPEAVIGLLGILKAGGAYVPFDPTSPKERLRFMLNDSGVSLLLTQRCLIDTLPESQTTMVCLERGGAQSACESDSPPMNNVREDNLAYVIYTSGSTGSPKGVLVPHRGLYNLARVQIDTFHIGVHDRILHFLPFSFDAATTHLFMALCSGATLYLSPEGSSLADLPRLLQEHKITHAPLTPSILAELSPDDFPALRMITVGAESCSRELVAKWAHGRRFFNRYGPTEATICCTTAECVDSSQDLSIGRPIANMQVYILDQNLQPVPVGIPGELHIGGVGLARGYLLSAELTAQKFVPNPFSDKSGQRIYKTGDLARYLPDANIEFLGRVDDQIKLRGFRIEPGEIETVLRQHPAVQEVVVLAREVVSHDKRLVGYVVSQQQSPPTTSSLRQFLRQKLPEYMIPSVFVFLDKLPLTPNGKIDRNALPGPEQRRPDLEEGFIPPRTFVEEELAQIWCDVLQLDRVGIHDNFFILGGHSLLATQLISCIKSIFDLEIPLQTLSQSPTVAGMAIVIRQTKAKQIALEDLEVMLTENDLYEHIANLSPEKLAILEAKLFQTLPNISPPKTIPRRKVKSPCSLSFAQQRLWFLDQLDPGNPVYNMPSAFRLSGTLHINVLEQSLKEIVRRHEALRTHFSLLHGKPVQVIEPSPEFSWRVANLWKLSPSEQEAEVRCRIREEADYAFDLGRGPLFRGTLLTLGKQAHILILVMHHIISDGWSWGVLFRELSVLYHTFLSGQPSPLPALPVQYADFAVWQREWLQGEVLEQQLAYWKQQLEGAPPCLDLPADYCRPAVQTHRGDQDSLRFSRSLSAAIHELSGQEDVTPFMTLLGAFALLLYRYTGQPDIVVGSPIAGRNRPEIERLIGVFLNSLALWLDLSGNPSFRELLHQVREVTLGAYEHQDIPFEKLLEELRIERSLSHSPLFQVFFNMLPLQDVALEFAGLTIERVPRSSVQAKFDLTVYVRESAHEFRLSCVYNPDLFTHARIEAMLQQYQSLVSQVVAQPDQKLSRCSLVTPAARGVLPDPRLELAEPHYDSVPAVFRAWAARFPNAPAICQSHRRWTYRALAAYAQRLAQTLLVQGLTPGDVVAVSGRRSVGLIAAMMGTFLSGGVLLPIDRTLPVARQRLMLEEAGARFLLHVETHQPPPAGVLEQRVPARIQVEPETGRPVGEGASPPVTPQPLPPLAPDDPAYIFFTSGTTGVPKGVVGCHKGLSHFLHWQRDTFAITPGDRVAHLTSLSFDVVLREIFLPLMSGATLCLPPDDEGDPGHRLHWLEYERISVVHTVPTVAQTWLAESPPAGALASLRWVFFAGEPLTDTLVRQWRTAFPQGGDVVNLYGPTETTLAKCVYQIPQDVLPGVQPIGRPISSTQALVFTADHQLCGMGEPGEIVVRTPFRTLGYLNAPEEQHTRFVTNPYHEDKRDLLYYTGDRGRYRPDGLLEILGRLDDQVKIRGVRVEPAEITATLSRHPSVTSCCVTAREDEQGHTVLVAYVVHRPKSHEPLERLQSYLSERLPSVMVPTKFVVLDELPLTSNGKIDRKALPTPDQSRPELDIPFAAPQTPVEKIIAGIWQEILRVQQVSVYDNFFDLGGHSLLVMQVIARIEQHIGVRLSPREFIYQTLGQIALVCEEKMILSHNPEPRSFSRKWWNALKNGVFQRSDARR